MVPKRLIIISGPTACGKTDLAINLAEKIQTCILSADSRQFYSELNIGSAKPGLDQLAQVQHYFIGHKSIHDIYTVADYESDAISLLDELFKTNDQVILTGGSTLFINAVEKGLDAMPPISEEVREKVQQIFTYQGIELLQELIREKDPEYAAVVDMNNPRRLMRASEVILETNLPFSHFRSGKSKSRNFKLIKLLIDLERDQLYQNINMRVQKMIEMGLETEVSGLLNFIHLRPLQTVGYQEWIPYFDQKIPLQEVSDLIAQHTRNYAKRQLTWFRNNPGWQIWKDGLI